MPYIPTFDRNQIMMCTWDSFVDPESIARIIDAFVDSLDMAELGVKDVAREGRPAYNPQAMFKLYIYGNRKGIRSSRKLAESCRINLEVKWLMGGLEPDFRTISNFRKDNIDSMKQIFHKFNHRIAKAVQWGYSSIDGSKFLANNSKDNNFTKNKLDDRIKWLDSHTEEYLRILKEMDAQEEREDAPERLNQEIVRETLGNPDQKAGKEKPENPERKVVEGKLKEARERLERYTAYQKQLEESGQSQLSLIDADAKLMKSKNGFAIAYNPQTAVDSETHLIRNFKMTNQVTDHGMLAPTMEEIREESPTGILEVVADKGYEQPEDMVKCLENGIIPHVITNDGKDGYQLEIPYEEADVDTSSTAPEEIKRTLHAGKIPEAYKNVISKMEVKEVLRRVTDEPESDEKKCSIYGTPEEMKARAEEGYFVRDPERNLVYCPAGEVLRQKCIKKGGQIRYSNKSACRNCRNRNKCYKGKNGWKEIDFNKDTLEKPCKDWLTAEGREATTQKAVKKKYHFEKRKVVRFFLKPDITKTSNRLCLSEHPFGTIKRFMHAGYFLLRGLQKVTGEFALFCLGYNIERARNLLGFEKVMRLMAGHKSLFFQFFGIVCFIQFSMVRTSEERLLWEN